MTLTFSKRHRSCLDICDPTRREPTRSLTAPASVEARVCIFSPDLGSEPWPWVPSLRHRHSLHARPLPVTSGHSVSFIESKPAATQQGRPRAAGRALAHVEPCPHTLGRAPCAGEGPMPAACAAEAHPRPCLAFANFPMGRAAVGGGPCAGPGGQRGRDPSFPGGPPSSGSKRFAQVEGEAGQAAACPDSVIQHCSAPLISMISASRRWRAAAEQQPAAPGAALPSRPAPGRLGPQGSAGAPRPAGAHSSSRARAGGRGLSPAAGTHHGHSEVTEV